MDLLRGNIKTIYFKYLAAAFGSALISSIYSLVDMAVVGQYQGPAGTAALAVVAPIWNIIYSLGLLAGIGGSVLFSNLRGRADKNGADENEYFTASLLLAVLFAVGSWLAVFFLDRPMLLLFGADQALMPLAQAYLQPIKFAVPLFVFNQMLSSFLRNDNHPGLATAAVLCGGVFNIIGDYLFVFTFDMGIYGAGLATALGALINFIVMISHFFTKKNTLRLVRPKALFAKSREITVTGFSTFFIDIAMGILTMLFNRQIMRYAGTDALAVYGIIVNVSTIVQCCGYSVGQAAQPLLSINFGANNGDRIKQTLKYALQATAFFSIVWTALTLLLPKAFVYIFMAPTPGVLAIAPRIMRSYGISFLLLPLNVFSTYYFQSLIRPGASMLVSMLRGMIISGGLIYLLPAVAGADALWFTMPITELIVAGLVVWLMRKYTKQLPGQSKSAMA